MTQTMKIEPRGLHLTDTERLALRIEALQQAVTLHTDAAKDGHNPTWVNEKIVESATAFVEFLDRV